MAIEGTYNLKLDMGGTEQDGVLTLATDGGKLHGSLQMSMGTMEFDNGTIDGDELTWTARGFGPMRATKIKFTATVAGDEISGVAKMARIATVSFTGQRSGSAATA